MDIKKPDYSEYDETEIQRAMMQLLAELEKGERSAREHGLFSEEAADAIIDNL